MYVLIMPKELLKSLQTCEADCDFASMHQNVSAQKPRISVCRVQCSHILGMLKKLLLAFNCYPQATRDIKMSYLFVRDYIKWHRCPNSSLLLHGTHTIHEANAALLITTV
jgi:hypothetical protein